MIGCVVLLDVRLIRHCTLRRVPGFSAWLLVQRVLPEQMLYSVHGDVLFFFCRRDALDC